jgi:hypothetical protein
MPDADFTGYILHTTDMAVKFYKDGDSMFDAVWLPRGSIAVVHLPDKKVRISMSEKFAEEKGLL